MSNPPIPSNEQLKFRQVNMAEYGPVICMVRPDNQQLVQILDDDSNVQLNVSEAQMVRDWLNKALPAEEMPSVSRTHGAWRKLRRLLECEWLRD